jgi:hypothetical protein
MASRERDYVSVIDCVVNNVFDPVNLGQTLTNGFINLLKLMIKPFWTNDSLNPWRKNELFLLACNNGHDRLASVLTRYGYYEHYQVSFCYQIGHLRVARLLLENGYDRDHIPISLAASVHNYRMMDYLLSVGKTLDDVNPFDYLTLIEKKRFKKLVVKYNYTH